MSELLTLTLFGSAFVFWIAIIIATGVLVLCDIEESGLFASISLMLFFILFHAFGNINFSQLLTFQNALIYLITGFAFSLIRTYFKGLELTSREKHDFELKHHVFRWWFFFPICALNWLFGTLLKRAFDWLYSKIEKFYQKLFNGFDEL